MGVKTNADGISISPLKTALQYADDALGIDVATSSYGEICDALGVFFEPKDVIVFKQGVGLQKTFSLSGDQSPFNRSWVVSDDSIITNPTSSEKWAGYATNTTYYGIEDCNYLIVDVEVTNVYPYSISNNVIVQNSNGTELGNIVIPQSVGTYHLTVDVRSYNTQNVRIRIRLGNDYLTFRNIYFSPFNT